LKGAGKFEKEKKWGSDPCLISVLNHFYYS